MKSCKEVAKQLGEMSTELEKIKKDNNYGDLNLKLEQAEKAKTEVEAALLKKVRFQNFQSFCINRCNDEKTVVANFLFPILGVKCPDENIQERVSINIFQKQWRSAIPLSSGATLARKPNVKESFTFL